VNTSYNLKELGLCRASLFRSRLIIKWTMLCFFALTGCTAKSTTVNNNIAKTESRIAKGITLDSTVELQAKEVSQYQNLTLRLIKIEDSRCTIGETCIWAGQLVVTLQITNNLNKSVEIKLIRKREAETAFNFGYSFRLLNVEPHPKRGKTILFSEQTVQIEIVKVIG
jgi:hypothetical protein